jgi:hypothetical protein
MTDMREPPVQYGSWSEPEDSGVTGRTLSGICMLVVAAVLLAYSFLRAYRVPFVHDEATTYLMYIILGPKALLDCYWANNHFLNTILMYVSSKIFGTGELALRLPNIAGHAVYILAAYLLVRKRLTPFAAVCAFLLLNLNPFVLDLFSLARGYGMGLALMMLSLYFFLEAVPQWETRKRTILASLWCAWLSAFANLVFLNYLAALICAYFLVDGRVIAAEWSRPSPIPPLAFLRQLLARTGFFYKHVLLMMIIILPLAINMNMQGTFYYGGTSGFWRDTVVSLRTSSAYGCRYTVLFSKIGQFMVIFALVSCAFVFAYRSLWKGGASTRDLFIVLFMLAVAVLVVIFEHVCLGKPYPMDRTAIYFLPLLLVICVLTLEFLVQAVSGPARGIVLFVFAAGTALAVIHTVHCANLRYAYLWRYDADTRQMLDDLAADLDESTGRITFGINWLFEPSINYYYATKRPAWLPIVTRDGIKGKYDYYYVRPDDRPELAKKKAKIIKEYKGTGNILARGTGR